MIMAVLLLLISVGARAQDWQNDLKQAQLQAQKEHKEILLVFQGSDWCAPCIKLDREIWTSSEFKDYAREHYILVKADFPRRAKNQPEPAQQEKNKALAARYNPEGFFPLVVLMDPQGQVLGKTGYKKLSTKEYIAHLHSFKGS